MGASTLGPASNTAYTVPVTVPTGGGWLTAIESAWVLGSSALQQLAAGVYADNGGEPGELISVYLGQHRDVTIDSTARWITVPIGVWLPAGIYHIGVGYPAFQNSTALLVDTGGSSGDGHTVVGTANGIFPDGDLSGATVTATTSTYSVRGVFLVEADDTVSGALAVTEQADTLAATATFTPPAVSGAANVTEADDSLSATGSFTPATITGTANVTEQNDTATASGTFTPPPITGTLAATEADDTLDAAGTVTPPTITGTLAQTEADDTLTASGTVTVPTFTGALAVTETDDTLEATGTVVNVYTGTLAVTEADDTLAAVGTVHVDAPWYVSDPIGHTSNRPDYTSKPIPYTSKRRITT